MNRATAHRPNIAPPARFIQTGCGDLRYRRRSRKKRRRTPARLIKTGCGNQPRADGRSRKKQGHTPATSPRPTKRCQCLEGACLCRYVPGAERFVKETKLLATYDHDSEQQRQLYGGPMSPFRAQQSFSFGEDWLELQVESYSKRYWRATNWDDRLCWVLG